MPAEPRGRRPELLSPTAHAIVGLTLLQTVPTQRDMTPPAGAEEFPVKRLRTLSRSVRDWRRIWNALAYMRERNETGEIKGTPPTARDCFLL